MLQPNRHLPLSVTIAVIVHVVVLALLVINYQAKRELAPSPKIVINTVKAKVIDAEELAENERRRQEALKREELEHQRKLAEQKRLEQERLKREEENRKLQAELEVEKKKVLQAEQKAKLERKKAEEASRLAEQEKKRLLAEQAKRVAQQKKAAEAKRLAEQKRIAEAKKLAAQKKAAEAKRLAEQKKRREQELAAINKQRLASLEKEETELRAEAQRMKRARELSRLIAEYQIAIRNKIERYWRRPLDYQDTAECTVLVRQSSQGVVENVIVEDCTGNDVFRKSVENAVWKANPLPMPPSPDLFDQEVRFTFSPRSS